MMVSTPSRCFLLFLSVTYLSWLMGESRQPLGAKSIKLAKRQKRCTTSETFPCHCHKDTSKGQRLIVVCSGFGLVHIPADVPHSAVELYLNNNSIKHIPNHIFQFLTSLETLDISENIIDSIDRFAFTGLGNLRRLRLNNNNLNISKGSLPSEVFAPLLCLAQLDLQANARLDCNNFEYPDTVVGQLTALTNLHIDGVSNATFGPGFKSLHKLESLDLSGTRNFQYVSKLMFEVFYYISLTNLNLSRCDLRWINPGAFSSLPNIVIVDLSYNGMLEVCNVGKSAYGLRNTTIRKLIAQSIHTGPEFTRISKEDVINIGHTRLEELYVDYNNIILYDINAIAELPNSLQVLSISHNHIQAYTRQIFVLFLLRNLRDINVSFQLAYTKRDFKSSRDGVDRNSLSHNVSKYQTIQLNMPINLTVVNCSRVINVANSIPRIILRNCHIKILDFSGNKLHHWIGPIVGVETVTDLDLSRNNCKHVSSTFFAYATGLQRLSIEKNQLGPKLNDLTFYNLTNLERINLSNNRLEHVTSGLFYRLTKIHYLDLSYNAIAVWEAKMASLRNLYLLDLRSNKLSVPPVSLLKDLDLIRISSNVTVTFFNNPLQCFCETEYFLHWLSDTHVFVSDLNTTTCSLSNGTSQSLSKKQVILEDLKKHCRSFASVVGVLSACIGLILCIIIGKILRRYRWKLTYLYYLAVKRGERTGYQTLDGAVADLFTYDAFVSYEDSERDFIIHNVLPKLEREKGLKLCIDRRDFTLGMYITENIMNAIQNSRKTVVLLSKMFLKSKWCMYEMNMARMESLYNGRETLVIVMMEGLDARDLTAEVLEILHSQSYIEKTADPIGEVLFWGKLTSAIKDIN